MQQIEASNETKKMVINACQSLIDAKAKKARQVMIIEGDGNLLKMSHYEFMKMIERMDEEQTEFLKETMRQIYREQGKEKFRAFVEEAKNYTDAEFLKDVEDIWGIEEANFFKNLINRLEHANSRKK